MKSFLFEKRFSSFTYLNITQFLGALNDNIFKMLIVFLLIDIEGIQHTNTILATAGAVFVIPFLVFSQASGTIADRCSKKNIIVITKVMEVVIMASGIIAFAMQSKIGAYAVLFCMATQSTLFSPAKYGIVPEVVSNDRITKANGLLSCFTYIAIIIGTFLASFLTQVTGRNFVLAAIFCTLVSLLGAYMSFFIEHTPPAGSRKNPHPFFLLEIYRTLMRAKKYNHLLTAILGAAYFLFIGTFVQLNIIPFTIQSLGGTDVEGGYLFLLMALGIGVGSMLAGKLSGKEVELGLIPLGGIGIAVCSFLLNTLSSSSMITIAILVIILGMFGGLYLVPFESFIQVASPNKHRGQTIAAGNFVSFSGVLVASGALYLFGEVLGLRASQEFAIIGILTLGITTIISIAILDYLVRFLALTVSRALFKIKIAGRKNLPIDRPAMLVCNHSSWMSALLLLATQRHGMRFIIECRQEHFRWLAPFYRLIKVIPFTNHESPIYTAALLRDIKRGTKHGFSVCLYLNHTSFVEEENARSPLRRIFDDTDYPIIPAWVEKYSTKKCLPSFINWIPRWKRKSATITFGKEIARAPSPHNVYQKLLEVRKLNKKQ